MVLVFLEAWAIIDHGIQNVFCTVQVYGKRSYAEKSQSKLCVKYKSSFMKKAETHKVLSTLEAKTQFNELLLSGITSAVIVLGEVIAFLTCDTGGFRMAFCLGKQDLLLKGYNIYCDYRKTVWFKNHTESISVYMS